jgi:regulation of enolase protein 1 (concanavalin A-like superfamily)
MSNPVSRRSFLAGATATALALTLPDAVAQQTGTGPFPEGKWLNPPHHWKSDGASLIVTADPKTDFWRTTFYGYVTDNGHLYYRSLSGEFTTTLRVTGQYHDLYDQAGLMVRLDERNWMKCGVEVVDGAPHMSVVFTRDYSDWSTFTLGNYSGPLWLKVVRQKDSLDIAHSLNGHDFVEDRQGYFQPDQAVMVGPMCAAPEGKGFEVRFEDWTLGPPPKA